MLQLPAQRRRGRRQLFPDRDDSYYDTHQAGRLTKVPLSTLGYWIHEGVVTPSRRIVASDNRVVQEGFSFADLAYLRVLRYLRIRGVPLEVAVDSLRHLMDRFGPPSPRWRDARVLIHGNRVFAYEPDPWRTTMATKRGGGQRIEETFFGDLFSRLRDEADSILIPPEHIDVVEINPRVVGGMPVIRGTRIPTALIRSMASEMRPERISRVYPFLSRSQIRGAIEYEEYLDRSDRRAA